VTAAAGRELPQVMDEGGDDDHAFRSVEMRLEALVLPRRVQLAEKEPTAGREAAARLGEDKTEIGD